MITPQQLESLGSPVTRHARQRIGPRQQTHLILAILIGASGLFALWYGRRQDEVSIGALSCMLLPLALYGFSRFGLSTLLRTLQPQTVVIGPNGMAFLAGVRLLIVTWNEIASVEVKRVNVATAWDIFSMVKNIFEGEAPDGEASGNRREITIMLADGDKLMLPEEFTDFDALEAALTQHIGSPPAA